MLSGRGQCELQQNCLPVSCGLEVLLSNCYQQSHTILQSAPRDAKRSLSHSFVRACMQFHLSMRGLHCHTQVEAWHAERQLYALASGHLMTVHTSCSEQHHARNFCHFHIHVPASRYQTRSSLASPANSTVLQAQASKWQPVAVDLCIQC